MRIGSSSVFAAMVVSLTALHAHAWTNSRPDQCGEPNPECRPACGQSYANEFPVRYIAVAALLTSGAATLSLRRTRGRGAGHRWLRALALAGVAYLAIHPLSFTLSDWHGESGAFSSLFLMLIAFPVDLPLLPIDVHVFWSGPRPPLVEFPYLGGDPMYGPFSTALAARFVALGACAYLQWLVLVPWLLARCLGVAAAEQAPDNPDPSRRPGPC